MSHVRSICCRAGSAHFVTRTSACLGSGTFLGRCVSWGSGRCTAAHAQAQEDHREHLPSETKDTTTRDKRIAP